MTNEYTGQAVIFECADTLYAFDISIILEINSRSRVTYIPKLPPYISGVVSLMGDVVPVIDLRRKLGLPEGEDCARSCLIVIQSADDELDTTVTAAVKADRVITSQIYDPNDPHSFMKLPEQSVIAGYFYDDKKRRVSFLNEKKLLLRGTADEYF